MTYYILKKDIIFSRIFYEENCSNKIMMIHMRVFFEYEKILELLWRKYWWFNMSKNVKEYVISCTKCFLTKSIRHKFYELLQSLSIYQKLEKNWTMNFIVNLSFNKRREQIYDVILIVIDRYAKYFKCIFRKKRLNSETFDEQVIWRNIFQARHVEVYNLSQKFVVHI